MSVYYNANLKGSQVKLSEVCLRRILFAVMSQAYTSVVCVNPKFPASNDHLWLCSPVCVWPGRKPQRQFFHDAAYI